ASTYVSAPRPAVKLPRRRRLAAQTRFWSTIACLFKYLPGRRGTGTARRRRFGRAFRRGVPSRSLGTQSGAVRASTGHNGTSVRGAARGRRIDRRGTDVRDEETPAAPYLFEGRRWHSRLAAARRHGAPVRE